MTVNIPSRLALCGLLLPFAANAAAPLYSLPAYTKWCVEARLEGEAAVSGAALEEARVRATRSLDEKLSAARVASSSVPYVDSATPITVGAPDKLVRAVRLNYCVVVPPSSQPGPSGEGVAVRVTPPGELMTALACEAANAVACLTRLRADLVSAIPSAGKEAIDQWPWRSIPSRTDVRGQELKGALTDFGIRPTIWPESTLTGQALDPPARDAAGKPVLRPLRKDPVAAAKEPPADAASFGWVVVAITVPPSLAAPLGDPQ